MRSYLGPRATRGEIPIGAAGVGAFELSYPWDLFYGGVVRCGPARVRPMHRTIGGVARTVVVMLGDGDRGRALCYTRLSRGAP